MTAEVAVLNRLGVALAADSAVTIQGEQETAKIFQSETKLFELSETKPVGLMIYNATSFFGIPWEIIIKDFRRKHGSLNADKIFDWVPIFQSFLMDNYKPTESQQDEFVEELLSDEFRKIMVNYSNLVIEIFRTAFPSDEERDAAYQARFNTVLDRAITEFRRWHDEGFDDVTLREAEKWVKHHRRAYQAAYNQYFARLPLGSAERRKIRRLAAHVLKCSRATDFTTGLVFAGFGDNELFPSLQCIEVSGVIAEKLKVHEQEKIDIDRKSTTGAVVPFAQRETADSMIFGRSLDYELMLVDHFQGLMEELGNSIVDQIISDEKQKTDYRSRITRASEAAMKEFFDEISPAMRDEFSSDIIDIVKAMPKQELAIFAEALVNVTSIKRKVSVGPETVGGPVDVAVISRHEGFVWVKRKLYFPPELNPRYHWRAFGFRGGNENDTKRNGQAN